MYLQGGHRDDEVRLCTEVHKGNTTDTGHKLKPVRFRLDMRRKCSHCEEGSSALIQDAQKDWGFPRPNSLNSQATWSDPRAGRMKRLGHRPPAVPSHTGYPVILQCPRPSHAQDTECICGSAVPNTGFPL